MGVMAAGTKIGPWIRFQRVRRDQGGLMRHLR